MSLKIKSDDVSEYQKPNQNTLMNLKYNQMNLQRNQYNPYDGNYYSNQLRQQIQERQAADFNIMGKNYMIKDIYNNMKHADQPQKIISSVQSQSAYQSRYSLSKEQQTLSLHDEIIESNDQLPNRSSHFTTSPNHISQNEYQTFDNKRSLLQIIFKQQSILKKLSTYFKFIVTSCFLKTKILLFFMIERLWVINRSFQLIGQLKIQDVFQFFQLLSQQGDFQDKQKGFTSLNVMIIDLKTQKYNLFRKVTPTKEKPYILTQVFVEKELLKDQYVQEVLIEKMMYKGNLLGHAQLPSDVEKQILQFYFLLAFTLDGHMDRLQQVDFALTKVKDFLELKNYSFRKTFNVDLVKIVGEKVHRGLVYHEQGDEIFQNVNLYNYSSSAINLNQQTTINQNIGKKQRQINEIKCYTKSQIVMQNKIKRDLMSSQKIYRRPDLLRQHSQQCLREAKTSQSPINANVKFQQQTTTRQYGIAHKSSDNIFQSKFPSNGIIQFQRLKTPYQQSNRDDLMSRDSNLIVNSYKDRSELLSQNSLRKKQGSFNIFSQIQKQEQINVQQSLNLQAGNIGGLSTKKSSFSLNNLALHQPNLSTFSLLYHDNNEIKFQEIVPFVDYLSHQQTNEPLTDRQDYQVSDLQQEQQDDGYQQIEEEQLVEDDKNENEAK